jgi:hypothetical protein
MSMSYRIHRIKPYLVVEVTEDYGLRYHEFATYEDALDHVKKLECKSCILGPDFIEDHT